MRMRSPRGSYLFRAARLARRESVWKCLNVIRRVMKLLSNRSLGAHGANELCLLTLKPRTDCPSARRHMRREAAAVRLCMITQAVCKGNVFVYEQLLFQK